LLETANALAPRIEPKAIERYNWTALIVTQNPLQGIKRVRHAPFGIFLFFSNSFNHWQWNRSTKFTGISG